MTVKKLKPKKCRLCKTPFQPFNSTQVVCGWECAVGLECEKARKSERKALREARKKFRDSDRRYQLKEAQKAFNQFIRERDKNEPCISCGRHHNGQFHAGHYRTTKAMPQLRFEETNCWKQCAPCNNHLSGNIVEYRIALLKKLGEQKLAWLEGNHPPKKYTIEEIIAIKDDYKQKCKELKSG